MFESKLILKLPPFSLTYTVREKRRQFKNELTLKHSEVILELSWLYIQFSPKVSRLAHLSDQSYKIR